MNGLDSAVERARAPWIYILCPEEIYLICRTGLCHLLVSYLFVTLHSQCFFFNIHDYIKQGSPNLFLEGRCPAEFSSNPNQTHLKQLIKLLLGMIETSGQVCWSKLELNSAGPSVVTPDIKEWLFFSFSLPLFLWTGLLRCWVCVCCFVLSGCYVVRLKKKRKKLITKKESLHVFLSGSYSCHGAHSRKEQGHADEDVNSNSSL